MFEIFGRKLKVCFPINSSTEQRLHWFLLRSFRNLEIRIGRQKGHNFPERSCVELMFARFLYILIQGGQRKQNKTKQNKKDKQNETKQNKTKQNKTKQTNKQKQNKQTRSIRRTQTLPRLWPLTCDCDLLTRSRPLRLFNITLLSWQMIFIYLGKYLSISLRWYFMWAKE